jgi:putative two-component system response regulator
MAKILIVDDEQLTSEMLATFLRLLGHESTEAYTVRHARDKLVYFAPDLVLLDIMLPDANGLDFCRELRANPHTALLPVIMISAMEPPMLDQAREVGATEYLRKPITIATLRDALQKMGLASKV